MTRLIPYQNEHGVWAGELDADDLGGAKFTRVELSEAGLALCAEQPSQGNLPIIGDDLYRINGGTDEAVKLGTATFFAVDTQAILLQNIGIYIVRAFCQIAPDGDDAHIDTTATLVEPAGANATGFTIFQGTTEGAISDALVVRPQGVAQGQVVYSQTGLIVPGGSPLAMVPFIRGPFTEDDATWSVVTPSGQPGPPLRFDIAYLGGVIL